VSEESLAGIPNQTPDEKAHTMGALLASTGPTSRMGGQHEMTRKLEPDSIKYVTSCGDCGIRNAEYFVFTYDLTNKFTNRHMFQSTQGTQVLYMLKEKMERGRLGRSRTTKQAKSTAERSKRPYPVLTMH
jgi:hypothetical protein